MHNYPDVPLCPTCGVRSGLKQCVKCGRDYELKAKREAAKAAKAEVERIAALIPLKVDWPESNMIRVYFK